MKRKKYGAIDIGSNAIRLLLVNVFTENEVSTFKKVSLTRVPLRLGEDVFMDGKISQEKAIDFERTMIAFEQLMKVHKVDEYRATATSAMRDASNGPTIVEGVRERTGIEIEVISGDEEAKIIRSTHVQERLSAGHDFLYVDVGGGSSEFSVLQNGKRIVSKSFKTGTVRMLNNMVNEKVWLEIEKWIRTHTAGIENIALLGSGGNINKVFKLSNTKEGKPLTYIKINTFYQDLKKLNYDQRILKYNLNLDRADVILPALEIYLKALKWSGATKVFVPKIGLADGMIKMMYKKYNA